VNEYGRLERILLKHARDAFVDQATIDAQWRDLNFTERPDLAKAITEYERLVDLISSTGATIDYLPPDPHTTLDSVYVRDAALVTSRGVILCAMGKRQRAAEPDALGDACATFGIPVIGRIEPPGRIEGGDVVWLGGRTLVVGRGYRTNDAGIGQLRTILGPTVDVVVVPLPHWTGEHDVMHLMSLISPVDADLAIQLRGRSGGHQSESHDENKCESQCSLQSFHYRNSSLFVVPGKPGHYVYKRLRASVNSACRRKHL
jgi:N-dimethylarginine dimethylaminohydrolase